MSEGMEIFKIVTANRLRDGAIVYLRDGREGAKWTPSIMEATSFGENDIEPALARAKKFEDDCLVIGVYAAEVTNSNKPLSAREEIRAHGPSVKYGPDSLTPDFSI